MKMPLSLKEAICLGAMALVVHPTVGCAKASSHKINEPIGSDTRVVKTRSNSRIVAPTRGAGWEPGSDPVLKVMVLDECITKTTYKRGTVRESKHWWWDILLGSATVAVGLAMAQAEDNDNGSAGSGGSGGYGGSSSGGSSGSKSDSEGGGAVVAIGGAIWVIYGIVYMFKGVDSIKTVKEDGPQVECHERPVDASEVTLHVQGHEPFSAASGSEHGYLKFPDAGEWLLENPDALERRFTVKIGERSSDEMRWETYLDSRKWKAEANRRANQRRAEQEAAQLAQEFESIFPSELHRGRVSTRFAFGSVAATLAIGASEDEMRRLVELRPASPSACPFWHICSAAEDPKKKLKDVNIYTFRPLQGGVAAREGLMIFVRGRLAYFQAVYDHRSITSRNWKAEFEKRYGTRDYNRWNTLNGGYMVALLPITDNRRGGFVLSDAGGYETLKAAEAKLKDKSEKEAKAKANAQAAQAHQAAQTARQQQQERDRRTIKTGQGGER